MLQKHIHRACNGFVKVSYPRQKRCEMIAHLLSPQDCNIYVWEECFHLLCRQSSPSLRRKGYFFGKFSQGPKRWDRDPNIQSEVLTKKKNKNKPSDGISTPCHAATLTYVDTSPLQHISTCEMIYSRKMSCSSITTQALPKASNIKTHLSPSSCPAVLYCTQLRALHRQLTWHTWYEKKQLFYCTWQEHTKISVLSDTQCHLASADYHLMIYLYFSLHLFLWSIKTISHYSKISPNTYLQKECTYILGLNFITKKLWWEKNQYEVWTALRAPACTEHRCITALWEASIASHICSKLAGST